jgi:hypothetical protein
MAQYTPFRTEERCRRQEMLGATCGVGCEGRTFAQISLNNTASAGVESGETRN